MPNWVSALMPKEGAFFDLFEAHARVLVATAQSLRELLKGGDQVADLCRRISQQEQEADAVARQVLAAVRRTFITPFDRSDIQALTASLDDAVDQMHQTAKAVTLYEFRSFDEVMRGMGDLIVTAAETTARALPLLRSMGRNVAELNRLTAEVKELENRSDDLYDQGKKALFLASRSDPMAFIVGAEIYQRLEEVLDRLEDVADHIDRILVEHL